jgi:hypothetical protein
MPHFVAEKVIEQLWPEKENPGVYVILDLARDKSIYPRMIEASVPSFCLYQGNIAQPLAEVAPYIVQLQNDSVFTKWLLQEGWGNSWGIFLSSLATISELRRHFRRFILVQDESTGDKFYFRYYDPRVFRVYLPTCTKEELDLVFGPVQCFFCENDSDDTLIEYRHDDDGLNTRIISLPSEAGSEESKKKID